MEHYSKLEKNIFFSSWLKEDPYALDARVGVSEMTFYWEFKRHFCPETATPASIFQRSAGVYRHGTSVPRGSHEWPVEFTMYWSILDFLTAPASFSCGDHSLSSFPFLQLCNGLLTLWVLPALTRMPLNQWQNLQEEYQVFIHVKHLQGVCFCSSSSSHF